MKEERRIEEIFSQKGRESRVTNQAMQQLQLVSSCRPSNYKKKTLSQVLDI